MAGFNVVWANEFVPAAQDSYRANMETDCVLDCRDVKQVTPEDVLWATGLQVGELDLLDGSPPCQAFSTAGKRARGWGKDKKYEHGAKQKNETLFDEYIRLLRGLQPKTFVAENVSGLVKGVAKGFFIEILKALKDCGYNVKAKLLDAQWLGVPQMRQRIIFVGVRHDLGLEPVHPAPLTYRYSVRDALPDIDGIKSGAEHVAQKPGNSFPRGVIQSSDKPCFSISCDGMNGTRINSAIVNNEKRKFAIAELKRICAFPDDFILTGSYAQQWERLGNSVPPVMMCHIASTIKTGILDKLGSVILV
jgi:DNA (cytosine-5)-methyltransferase 1